jgi:hypothetical protein
MKSDQQIGIVEPQRGKPKRIRPAWSAALGGLALFVLLLLAAGALPHSSAKAQSGPDERPDYGQPDGAPAPFLTIVPSADGRELLVSAGTGHELDSTLYASVGIGETGIKEGWTMTYSETVQAYLTTATGFTPERSQEGQVAISTTTGLATEATAFVRAYVPNDGPQTIRSADGALELQLPGPNTLPAAAYIAVVPSYTPPGAAPTGQELVGPVYSVRAAGALAQSDKPFLVRLYYAEGLLAGRAPESLTIFYWNSADGAWQPLGGRLFADQGYVSVATDQFGTYALIVRQGRAAEGVESLESSDLLLDWLRFLLESIDATEKN